ncbi:hypothetical protein [Burkholderia sp. JKS000303]|uniref:hypothetical protein n=1 Tax=Burkholderia sp. JKS000303 TaxID=1938747 RepID=UPI00211D2343|nr:hypothetical protein [Burkholderia sp. JKS000303]
MKDTKPPPAGLPFEREFHGGSFPFDSNHDAPRIPANAAGSRAEAGGARGVARPHADISNVSAVADNGAQHPVEHTKHSRRNRAAPLQTYNSSGHAAASGSTSSTRT